MLSLNLDKYPSTPSPTLPNARVRRRLERHGLDAHQLLVYAADTAKARQRAAWERLRFGIADARAGAHALEQLDKISAHGESHGRALLRAFLEAAA